MLPAKRAQYAVDLVLVSTSTEYSPIPAKSVEDKILVVLTSTVDCDFQVMK